MSTADAPPPAISAPAPAAPAAPAPSTSALNLSRYADANADHVMLFPTAETHPRGTLFFTDYEIIILNVGYAVTDRFELELAYTLPALMDVAMKLNVHRSDWLRFAVVGAVDLTWGPARFPPIYRLDGVGTLCFSSDCWSSISFNAMGFAGASELYPHQVGTAFSAGAIGAITRRVKLMLEPVVLWDPGPGGGRPELAWSGGVRFAGEVWGLNIGVIPGGQEVGPWLPWLSFTLRTRGARPPG